MHIININICNGIININMLATHFLRVELLIKHKTEVIFSYKIF